MNIQQIASNTASLADYPLYEAINQIREMGFGGIELLAFDGARHSIGDLAGFWFDELTQEERDQLKERLTGFHQIALHAPFIDLPLFTHNPGIQREAVSQIKEAIEAAWFFGAKVVTVHANRKTGFALEEFWSEMVDIFSALGDFAKGCGIQLGIETGYPNTVKDYLKLFLDINHEAVGATVDVGHLVPYIPRQVLQSNEGPGRYNDVLINIVRILGSKIVHFHVHDVRRPDWRDHRAVGTGIINFEPIFMFMDQIGYEGLFSFELEEPEKEAALAESKVFVERLIERVGRKNTR